MCRRRVFVEVFDAILIDEKVRLRFASDSDDVLIVVLDPALHLLAIDQFNDDGSATFRKSVNIFGLAESRFRRGLPPVPAAGVFVVGCSSWHVRSIQFSML